MPVVTPLSLNNILAQFGLGVIASYEYTSGSGTITSPAEALYARITMIGGGGGGGTSAGEDPLSGGGGGGGFTRLNNLGLEGGITTVSYTVGSGGSAGSPGNDGASGGTTQTSLSNSVAVYYAYGGGGGQASGDGGTAGQGDGAGDDFNPGAAGDSYISGGGGGISGGASYGLGAYGGGGAQGSPGNGGYVKIEFLSRAFSTFYRGTGEIPSHAANLAIPTSSPSDLQISQFDGAEKSFTATITSADISGTQNPPTTYATRGFNGVSGSINRSQVGINRNNTSSTNLLSVVETPSIFYDLLGNPSGYIFGVTASFSGDVRSSTLGYDFFSSISINGLNGGSIGFASQSYDGTKTTFSFLGGFSQGFGANGSSNSVELVYGGP